MRGSCLCRSVIGVGKTVIEDVGHDPDAGWWSRCGTVAMDRADAADAGAQGPSVVKSMSPKVPIGVRGLAIGHSPLAARPGTLSRWLASHSRTSEIAYFRCRPTRIAQGPWPVSRQS